MTLPLDYCRCQGVGCDRKETCQRYTDRANGTPWTERYCPDNNPSEGYIAVREDRAQS